MGILSVFYSCRPKNSRWAYGAYENSPSMDQGEENGIQGDRGGVEKVIFKAEVTGLTTLQR